MIRKVRSLAVVMLLASAAAFAVPAKNDSLAWGGSPEAYFLTAEERHTWGTVRTKEEADKFIAEYWRKHGESFRNEVKTRIAAADKHFALEGKAGSETQMGRVFMLLGAPDRQMKRTSVRQQGGSIISVVDWIYKADKLPKELGLTELSVRFQTDSKTTQQTIENPGRVEPFLKKFIDYQMAQMTTAAPVPAAAQTSPAVPQVATPSATVDPSLWTKEANLQGAFFTGESFISPTEKSFYAYSFYLPKSVAAMAAPQNIVMAGSIRDASGNEVATFRQQATPVSYDDAGDRFADGSVELVPGKYNGVFAMYAADGSTLLATARTEFEVPDVTTTRVSRPLLTSRIDTLETQAAFDPFTFVAQKYAVKGSNVFRKSESVGFFTFIANPVANPEPSMMMRMKVSRGGKVIETTPLMPANLQQTGPHTYLLATRFDANTLQPGHYKLDITVRDMNAPKDTEAYTKGYVRTVEFDVKD
jgi:GWxTD domain-containing protein